MSYKLVVNIAPDDFAFLVQNGFWLAAKINYTDTQWWSVPITNAITNVSWSDQYQAFYSMTPIQVGSIITADVFTPASLGQAYSFSGTAFTQTGAAPFPTDIRLLNDTAVLYNLGFAQAFTSSTGVTTFSPFGLWCIIGYGFLWGEASKYIDLYFTQTPGNGLIISPPSNTVQISVSAGSTVTVGYSGGKWGTPSTSSGADKALESAKIKSLRDQFWHGEFVFTLAAPVDAALFVDWLNTQGKDSYTIASWSMEGSTIRVAALGSSDASESLVGLKGTYYSPPVTRTLVEAGRYVVSGSQVLIESVVPFRTLDTALFNLVHKYVREY